MKPLSKKQQQVIAAILVGMIFLAALVFPGHIEARQTTPEPTPTSTPLPENLDEISRDTESLIWGAAIILVIILSGVLIQRFFFNRREGRSKGRN